MSIQALSLTFCANLVAASRAASLDASADECFFCLLHDRSRLGLMVEREYQP